MVTLTTYLVFSKVIKLDMNEKKMNILSFGYNHYIPNKIHTIHAEHDSINKLPYYTRQRSFCSINILVVRLSKNNKLGMSRPCKNCIRNMNILPPKKGYTIKDVYYSDSQGNIIKTTLNKLLSYN